MDNMHNGKESKSGKWICYKVHIDGMTTSTWNRWSCSECKTVIKMGWSTSADGVKPLYKWCPECGAKIEVEDNENQT